MVNTRWKIIIGEHKYNPKYVFWICALFSLLILLRSVNDIFFYAFAGISAVVFAISSTGHCVSFLFFLLPFATILKNNVDGMSIFTILFFLVILKMVIVSRKIDVRLFIFITLFATYSLLFSGMGQLTTVITMVSGILMLYYVRNDAIEITSVVSAYSAGICLSSVLALFKSSFPIINKFIMEAMLVLGEYSYASRFSGLDGNPNYYTMNVIMALSAIVVLIYNNKAKKIHIAYFVMLSVFGLMSVSKSFIISWVLLLVLWLFMSIRQGIGKFVKFLFIAGIGVTVIYLFAYDYIDMYLFRFLQDETGSTDSITTGRLHLWLAYADAIFNNAKTMWLGNGLKSILETLGKGAHNTLLEALFNIGIVGCAILAATLRFSMGKIKIERGIWIPIIILVVRIFSIGIFTHDNLWFFLAIIVMLAYYCKDQDIPNLTGA